MLDHIDRMEVGAAAAERLVVDLLNPRAGDLAKLEAVVAYKRALAEDVRQEIAFFEGSLNFLRRFYPEVADA